MDQAIQRAVDWLAASQQADGHWGDTGPLALRDTTEILIALNRLGSTSTPRARAAAWVAAAPANTVDSLSRKITALAPLADETAAADALAAQANAEGGWGIVPGYTSEPLDTALAVRALSASVVAVAQADAADPRLPGWQARVSRATTTLLAQQGGDGSWGVYPGAGGSVYVTATALLALRAAADAGAAIPADVLRSGALWLLAHRNADGTWGSGSNAGLTALAYQAALEGAAVSRIGALPAPLVQGQNADGSWSGDSYATAAALQTLAVARTIPDVRLGTVQLLVSTPAGLVASDSACAYQPLVLEAAPVADGLKVEAVVDGTAGGEFSPGDGGRLAWNTAATPPGAYAVSVLLRDTGTGLVVDEQSIPFTITPTVGVRALSVTTSPTQTAQGVPANVQVFAAVTNGSNTAGQVSLTAKVADAAGNVVAQSAQDVSLAPGQDPSLPPLTTFTPDVSAPQDYTVTVSASAGGVLLAEGSTSFRVLPPPPPTRIDVTQSVSPERVSPGEAEVARTITLTGQGQAGERKPLDLALAIDISGSMEWGDADWSYTKPSRLDSAKSASKTLVDMLQPEDRGALVVFTGWAYLSQPLTYDKAVLKRAIDNTYIIWWSTAIGMGIQTSRQHLTSAGRSDSAKYIVLLSDGGEASWSRDRVLAEADYAKAAGIPIYTIGLGPSADHTLLQQIADRTGGQFFASPSTSNLEEIMRQIGGIITNAAGTDVRVIDTIPSTNIDVDPATISPAPYSVTQANGNTVIEWRFRQLNIDETQNLGLTLNLHSLQPGENRVVAQNLQLLYTDVKGNPVTVQLDPDVVQVSATALNASVATDKPEYGADETVAISAQLQNPTDSPLTGQALIDVTDAQGTQVATLLTQDVALEPGATATLQATWNTGTTFAGEYHLRLRALDGDQLLGFAEQPFTITADGSALLETTIERSSFLPGEAVTVNSQVTSTSRNTAFPDLTVTTTVTGPDGQVCFSQTSPVAELVPGAAASVSSVWNAAGAAPGDYNVQTALMSGDQVLEQAEASFTIASTADTGGGLSGAVTTSPLTTLPSGDVTFAWQVANAGNADVTGATLRVIMADPETKAAIAQFNSPLSVAAGGKVEGQLPYSFDDLRHGPFLVAMIAELANGTEVPLASTGLVTVQPFTLSATTAAPPTRVLIWSAPGAGLDRVTASLTEQGYFYRVVTSAAEFQAELRTGDYGLIILVGGWPPELSESTGSAAGLTQSTDGLDHLDWELEQKVYGGTGLLVFGPTGAAQLADEQHRTGSYLGVKAAGPLPAGDYTAALDGTAVAPQLSLALTGAPARAQATTGTVVGRLTGADGTDEAAAITATYGLGHTLWLCFDPGTVVDPAGVGQILQAAVPALAGPARTGDALSLTALQVHVTGGQLPVSGQVEVSLPAGATLVEAAGGTVSGSTVTYQFQLTPGQQQSYTLLLRLPPTAGSLPVTLTGSYLAHGRYHPDVTAGATLTVEQDAASLLAATTAALPAGDPLTRQLTRDLDTLREKPPTTQQELDQAVHTLLQDIRRLESMSGDTTAAHLLYIRLLGCYQALWAQGR